MHQVRMTVYIFTTTLPNLGPFTYYLTANAMTFGMNSASTNPALPSGAGSLVYVLKAFDGTVYSVDLATHAAMVSA